MQSLCMVLFGRASRVFCRAIVQVLRLLRMPIRSFFTYGLLHEDVHIVANRPCQSTSLVEGLVIDDFFSISVDACSVAPEGSARLG